MRARALQLLTRIKGSEEHYLKEALKDADPDIRITGLPHCSRIEARRGFL